MVVGGGAWGETDELARRGEVSPMTPIFPLGILRFSARFFREPRRSLSKGRPPRGTPEGADLLLTGELGLQGLAQQQK